MPGVADLSLFRIDGLAALDHLFPLHETGQTDPLLYQLAMVLWPFGLATVLYKRQFVGSIGLLPGAMMWIGWIPHLFDPYIISVALSVAYKVAFLFFVVRGHLRTISFVAGLTVAVVLAGVWTMLLLLFTAVLFRTGNLLVVQNKADLSTTSRKRLMRVTLRSFLLWLPILLFTVPWHAISAVLKSVVTDAIYDETFIDRHDTQYLRTWADARERMERSVVEGNGPSITVFGSDTCDHVVMRMALNYVAMGTDSSWYRSAQQATADLRRVYALALLRQPPERRMPDPRLLDSLVSWVRPVVLRSLHPDMTDLELDILQSTNDLLTEHERTMAKELEHARSSLHEAAGQGQAETDRKVVEFEQRSSELVAQGTDRTEQYARMELAGFSERAKNEFARTPERVTKGFDSAMPPDLVTLCSSCGPSHCGFLKLDCIIMNRVKALLRSIYSSQREHARRALEAGAQSLVADANAEVDDLVADANAEVKKAGEEAKAQGLSANEQVAAQAAVLKSKFRVIQDSVSSVHKRASERMEAGVNTARTGVTVGMQAVDHYLRASRILGHLLFAMLILKSFVYVFSRVAFSHGQDLFVSLRTEEASEGPSPHGAIRIHGPEYGIPAETTERFFVSRRFLPTGRAPRIILPHWTSSAIARWLSNAYVMNQVAPRVGATESVEFRSQSGAEFVEWILDEGEEVTFDYRHFVAMTDTVSISTYISVRITSTLLGRNFFALARGPGRLVLMTFGRPMTNASEKQVRTVHVERLVAWQRNALYTVDSELNFADLYFSGVYLKRHSDHQVIIDADDAADGRDTGLGRFITSFLLPR